jgi:hypothetical protein
MDDPSPTAIKDDHGGQQLKRRGATTNMSTAAMAVTWFRRKLRQVGREPYGAEAGVCPTVAWLTSMPSLSSSPRM